MKRKLLALTVGLMIVGGASFAYGATVGAKVARVKMLFAPAGLSLHDDAGTVPGTTFAVKAGTTRFSFDTWAAGSDGSRLTLAAVSTQAGNLSVSYRTDCAGLNGTHEVGMGSEFGSTPPSGITFHGSFDRAFCTVSGFLYGGSPGNVQLGMRAIGDAAVFQVSGELVEVKA